ncbi:unnamed protein product, partial [Pleuronectes platessa]
GQVSTLLICGLFHFNTLSPNPPQPLPKTPPTPHYLLLHHVIKNPGKKGRKEQGERKEAEIESGRGFSSLISPNFPPLICSRLEPDEDEDGTTKGSALDLPGHQCPPRHPERPNHPPPTAPPPHSLPPLTPTGRVPPSCSPAHPDCA